MTSYLPARSLAAAVPLLVLAVVLVIDPPTALVLVFTGPVLLLLLALIGEPDAGDQRAPLRRVALDERLLPGHAARHRHAQDVRPERRAGRQHAGHQPAVTARRRMEVLRSAFQTGLVLDWAGAVAMALVAVEVSLRLMADAIPFERALAVLVIAPGVLPAVARQLAAALPRGKRRPGRRRAAVRDPGRTGADRAGRVASDRHQGGPRPPAIALDGVSYQYPQRDRRRSTT